MLEDCTSGNMPLYHATPAGELSVDCQKIIRPYLFEASWFLIREALLKERPTQLYAIPKINWRQE